MKNFRSRFSDKDTSIPTAALPDIIFMLLFFFMVTTVLKEERDVLKYKIPDAEQLKKIEKKSIVSSIIVGIPDNTELFGQTPRIEAGGSLLEPDDIIPYVMSEKEKLPYYKRDQIIILLKADKEVPMGIISDIQQELRKVNTRKIVYATNRK